MTAISFRRIRTTDKSLEKLQDGISQVVQAINEKFTSVLTSTMTRHPIPTEITAGGTNVDVLGVSVLLVNTAAGSITINNLQGGVNGQVLKIIKTNGSNTLTLSNASGGGGGEPMLMAGGGSLAITNFGGAEFLFRDGYWFHYSDGN